MNRRVTQSYARYFEVAPAVSAGTIVRFLHDDEKNPAWFFGAAPDGVEGYFPASWFQMDRPAGQAVALRDYVAMELSVETGDQVEVLETESGWCLVRGTGGEVGWVPEECLEGQSRSDHFAGEKLS